MTSRGCPAVGEIGEEGPSTASLLGVQIRRSRSANPGWTAGGQQPTATAPIAAASEIRAAPSERPGPPSAPAGDLFSYWHDRRDGRRFPAWSDFDPGEVSARWPNSVLLACGEDLHQPRLAAGFAEALRAAKRRDAETLRPGVEYTPLLTEWLLALGREVARLGRPLNDSESLPALKGRARYQIVGLPLGESPFAVDHVLCHVVRA